MEQTKKAKSQSKLIPHLIYLVIAFIVTSPAWIGTNLIIGGGDQPDWTGTAWAYWWTGHALTNGANPFDGNWNFYPIGQRPLAQYNLLDALLAWPLLKIFGVRLGYNLFALLITYSTAWGMHILTRTAGASMWPAIYAGVALETSSFLLLELSHGRLSQAMLIFWLLGLAGFLKTARGDGSWKLVIGTGICFAATSLTYWYWGLFLVFATIPIWIAEFWFWNVKKWLQILGIAAITAIICGPYVYALSMGYEALPGVGRELEPWMNYGQLDRGNFGLAMGIKQSHWPLWPLLHTATDPDDKRIALVPLILGIVACFRKIPDKKRWIAIMLLGYILTLGPYLKWTDKMPFRLSLPYLWLHDNLPFFERFWWPQRLELLVLIGLLVLGALFLERWALFMHTWGRRLVIAIIIATGIDIPLRNVHFPVESFPPRTFKQKLYYRVDGPVITTPVLSSNEITRHVLWLQTFHQQPILGGLGDHIESHRPRKYDKYIKDRPILNYLSQISRGTFQDATILPADVDDLLKDGFRWIVVDPAAYSPGLEERWASAFTSFCQGIWGNPTNQEGLGKAWKISPIPQSVYIGNIPPVEHAGPRTEEGFYKPTENTPGKNLPQ